MRYKHPRARDGYHGGFGGVGRGPADEAWNPERHYRPEIPYHVPRKWRRLRLRRRPARERDAKGPSRPPASDIGAGILLNLAGLASVAAAALDLLSGPVASLLFIVFCGLGAVLLGRGISKYEVLRRAADPQAARRALAHPSRARVFLAHLEGWIVLLGGCLAWLLVALPAMGPFHPIMVCVGVAAYLGLGFSLDVDHWRFRRTLRRRRGPGGRRRTRARRWSKRRCVIATLTGILLVAIGFALATRPWPEGENYVLNVGLCLIAACAFGFSLVGIAATSSPRPARRR